MKHKTLRYFPAWFFVVLLAILTATPVNTQKMLDFNKEKPVDDPPSVIGNDGNLTVAAANTVLNNYAVLSANVAAGATSFSVTNITDLDSAIPQLGTFAVGDLVMIIQMQGATINTTDTVNYGSVTALNSAGFYEFVTVGSIAGNTITINGEGCITGLRHSYTTAGHTQIVRIPQFNNLTVNGGASVVPTPWNGTKGGIIALQIANTLTLNGSLNANAAGFRGGALDNATQTQGSGIVIYRSTNSADGAEKGESIAGYQTDYDALGRYGRGAPANGGGGGDSHNAGGGGGANGNNGNTWTGQGVMPLTPLAAWQLDPGYIANGNALTNSSGGGRGGYTFSSNDIDATTAAGAPGQIAWGGDFRREVGGLGGRPLTNDPTGRLFLGGGGGAGDANNSSGGAGGNGGGMVYVMAHFTTGTGSITANGGNGASTNNTNNDAPGGGGGGGTVVIPASDIVGISINANGGNGGNQLITNAEGEGPGGGGAGGYIAIRPILAPTRTATGGTGGTTSSTAVSEFTRNGSTNGATGQPNATVGQIPICFAPTAAGVSVSGRLLTPEGRGLANATVMLMDLNGGTKAVITSPFGYFNFDDVVVGRTYVLSVSSKRYQFSPRVVSVVDEIADLAIIADR